MTPMINYSVAMLQAVAEFLASEPIIYLFSLVVLCFLAKLIRLLQA